MEKQSNNMTVYPRDKKFRFSCHHGLDCFNNCCRDINIYLTPYDVLRMKNKLGIKSGDFLENYTTQQDNGGFPAVLIKMNEDDNLKCPFLTPGGCQVYDVRSWACRIAPVDVIERGYGFIFDSTFCHGLNEDKEWTVEEWMQNQGLEIYEQKEKSFNRIPLHFHFTGMKNLDKHIKDVVFMACYDLDKFKKFIFDTGFLSYFWVNPEQLDKIREDDEALLQFSFHWLLNDFEEDLTMEIMDEMK